MTVNELIEALTDAVESDESLGDKEICIGDVQNGKIRRYEINDHAEVFMTSSEADDDDEEEERFWITVSQDAANFYKVPSDLVDQYR
jgi:hypothetical protein